MGVLPILKNMVMQQGLTGRIIMQSTVLKSDPLNDQFL
jgi:hypothetical protein